MIAIIPCLASELNTPCHGPPASQTHSSAAAPNPYAHHAQTSSHSGSHGRLRKTKIESTQSRTGPSHLRPPPRTTGPPSRPGSEKLTLAPLLSSAPLLSDSDLAKLQGLGRARLSRPRQRISSRDNGKSVLAHRSRPSPTRRLSLTQGLSVPTPPPSVRPFSMSDAIPNKHADPVFGLLHNTNPFV